MDEVWKDIYFIENGIEYDYRGLYQVSNFGRVKSLGNEKKRKEKILKARKNQYGYEYIALCKNGKGKDFKLHRLVAFMFIENDNPVEKIEIDHIDTNPLNNHVSNLRWCTRKENSNNPLTLKHHHERIHSEETKRKMSESHKKTFIK